MGAFAPICPKFGAPLVASGACNWFCQVCRIVDNCLRTDDGCLLWLGSRRGQYGVTRIFWRGKWRVRHVHRIMYMLHVTDVESGDAVVHMGMLYFVDPICGEV